VAEEKQWPTRETISAEEFTRRLESGQNLNDGRIVIQDLDVVGCGDCVSVYFDAFQSPQGVTLSNCRFDDKGLNLEGETGCGRVEIIHCEGEVWVDLLKDKEEEEPHEAQVIMRDCNLDRLITDFMFRGMQIQRSRIKSFEIDLHSVRPRQIDFSACEADRVFIMGHQLNCREGDERKELQLYFNQESCDIEQPALQVQRYIETDIPQVAQFFKLLCPNTPVHFTGDFRELL
jgi:hypothetical protein